MERHRPHTPLEARHLPAGLAYIRAFVASGVLFGGLVFKLIHGGSAVGIFLVSLPSAGALFVTRGAIQSYRLDRRRDASTHSE